MSSDVSVFVSVHFILFSAGPGSFLVRPSDNSPGDYSLFFHINNQIQRFRIEKKGVRYLMGGRTFECLDAVINRYRKEQIVEGHTLVLAVGRVSCLITCFSTFDIS
jgi:Ras GTPase-activating protein 1